MTIFTGQKYPLSYYLIIIAINYNPNSIKYTEPVRYDTYYIYIYRGQNCNRYTMCVMRLKSIKK